MSKKDTVLITESGKVIIDEIVDQIASKVPGINIAWGLAKSLYGAGLKLRQQKALEWVEMVQDNPNVFTRQLLDQEEFQDGFVLALEKYLTERDEEKRRYFRNIFLGYSLSEEKSSFPLERYIHALFQLSVDDIKVLSDVDINRQDKNYQIYKNEEKNITSIFNLINLGILHNDPSARLGPIIAPFVWISDFGREFIKYITSET